MHWNKWNGRQIPLEPPPEYKRFHAKAKMWPVINDWGTRPGSMGRLIETFVSLWNSTSINFFPKFRDYPIARGAAASDWKLKRNWCLGRMVFTSRKYDKNWKLENGTRKNLIDCIGKVGDGIRTVVVFAEHPVEDRTKFKKPCKKFQFIIKREFVAPWTVHWWLELVILFQWSYLRCSVTWNYRNKIHPIRYKAQNERQRAKTKTNITPRTTLRRKTSRFFAHLQLD